jgi:5-formaminoimidazole-4-carboxamide-1-beta-D-ribofuranosyl 5'-monophosphate synthetase
MFWQENYEDRAFALTTNNAANRSFNSAIQEIIKHGYIAVDELEMMKKISKSAPAHASRYKAQAKAMRALVRHSYNIDGDNPLGLEEMLSPQILEIGRRNIEKLEKTTPPTDRHLDKAIA